eukprot:1436127-Ditylum_brightwellii.AAC.1
MSNVYSYVHDHSDPGSVFLVMVGGEGYTRMIFPELKSEATLTAKGEFVHVNMVLSTEFFKRDKTMSLDILIL